MIIYTKNVPLQKSGGAKPPPSPPGSDAYAYQEGTSSSTYDLLLIHVNICTDMKTRFT